jgi:hypothetical protein
MVMGSLAIRRPALNRHSRNDMEERERERERERRRIVANVCPSPVLIHPFHLPLSPLSFFLSLQHLHRRHSNDWGKNGHSR